MEEQQCCRRSLFPHPQPCGPGLLCWRGYPRGEGNDPPSAPGMGPAVCALPGVPQGCQSLALKAEMLRRALSA